MPKHTNETTRSTTTPCVNLAITHLAIIK